MILAAYVSYIGAQPLALTVQVGIEFPLTLTLTPEERE